MQGESCTPHLVGLVLTRTVARGGQARAPEGVCGGLRRSPWRRCIVAALSQRSPVEIYFFDARAHGAERGHRLSPCGAAAVAASGRRRCAQVIRRLFRLRGPKQERGGESRAGERQRLEVARVGSSACARKKSDSPGSAGTASRHAARDRRARGLLRRALLCGRLPKRNRGCSLPLWLCACARGCPRHAC